MRAERRADGRRAIVTTVYVLWAAVLVPACSSNRHAAMEDASVVDATSDPADAATSDSPGVPADAASGDAAPVDGGVTPLPPSACGYTTTCVMGACEPGTSIDPSGTCACLRSDPVPCLGHDLLAIGGNHTCALVSDQVQCWGSNASGELGFDSPDRSLLPVPVTELTGLIPAVAAGFSHTCAIVEGIVKCWGSDAAGELGDGREPGVSPRHAAVQVVDLPPRAQAIALGTEHSCAIVDGAVWCWGSNGFGQVGDPGGAFHSRPVHVPVASGAQAIAAGGAHSCAIVHGEVWCWGDNQNGQLGAGGPSDQRPQRAIASDAQAISLGALHSCALLHGGVQCWGSNDRGQLGDGTQGQRNAPTVVPGLEAGVVAVAAGALHTCALLTDGAVKCWGDNQNGQLGIGSASSVPVLSPTQVTGLPAAQRLGSAQRHSCVIAGGSIWCWGSNFAGELGTDPDLGIFGVVPVQVRRLGCAGTPDLGCRVVEGCADGSADQIFDGNLVGCAGRVAFADRAILCGAGYQPATAAEWVARRRSNAPSHDYWTDDPLLYNGTGTAACFVSTTIGRACDTASPMRVCTASGTDAEGNGCEWTHCGLDVTAPDLFFGGCSGNPTAGALCMPVPSPAQGMEKPRPL
jgi:alpha-tubulin suppressor-like RCC1 family protein